MNINKIKIIKIINIIIVALIFSPTIVLAIESIPSFPMSFYGKATLNNQPLPPGTKIQAYSNNQLKGEVEMREEGVYGYNNPIKIKLLVKKYQGENLVFKYKLPNTNEVSTGDKVVQYSGIFSAGKTIKKNLNFIKKSSNNVSKGGGGGGGGYIDKTPPHEPTNFKITRTDNDIILTWDNPKEPDFKGVILVKSTSSLNNILGKKLKDQGELIYDGNKEIYIDTQTNKNTIYYYAISAYDNKGNYSLPLIIELFPKGESLKKQEDKTQGKEIKVLGEEYINYSNLRNLAGIKRSLVETITELEAKEIFTYNKFVKMNSLEAQIFDKITKDHYSLDDKIKYSIAYFIQFGTQVTKSLGAGERAGTLNSYINTFGKFPNSIKEWQDVIKIANGRWPAEQSKAAEDKAKENFKKIYLRNPDISNPHDNAAVTIMAYGLRPANRNLKSEKAAIKIFKNIFGYPPSSAVEWDMVRAIAYSGAVR